MKYILVTLGFVATSAFAHDGLGNHMTNQLKANSITAQVSQKRGLNNNFSITTTTQSTGTVINEYTDNNGVIFAITWEGPVPPNLEELLGEHFTAYKDPKNVVAHHSHSNLAVSDGNLIVQVKGHMRAFTGIAYLKNAIPQGVNVSQIQ
jgi:hypothetical protein